MKGVTVAFESKAPHTTPWLSIEYPVGEEPEELLANLAELGWKTSTRLRFAPPLDGMQEVVIEPPLGTGLFRGWKPEEARKNMPAVRRLLRRHGFDRVPWNRLELADLI
jgi:hypothetical protein